MIAGERGWRRLLVKGGVWWALIWIMATLNSRTLVRWRDGFALKHDEGCDALLSSLCQNWCKNPVEIQRGMVSFLSLPLAQFCFLNLSVSTGHRVGMSELDRETGYSWVFSSWGLWVTPLSTRFILILSSTIRLFFLSGLILHVFRLKFCEHFWPYACYVSRLSCCPWFDKSSYIQWSVTSCSSVLAEKPKCQKVAELVIGVLGVNPLE